MRKVWKMIYPLLMILVLGLAGCTAGPSGKETSATAGNAVPTGTVQETVAEKTALTLADFEFPVEMKQIRVFEIQSSKGREQLREYETTLPLGEIKQWLTETADRLKCKVLKDLTQDDGHFMVFLELPWEEPRRVYAHTFSYAGHVRVSFLETTYKPDASIEEIHEGESLVLFLPLEKAGMKEILITDYFHVHSDEYYLASCIMKEYNDRLARTEGALKADITGDEALKFPVEWVGEGADRLLKLGVPDNRLPKPAKLRGDYLSGLAVSLLTGMKNSLGEMGEYKIQIHDQGRVLAEFTLDDFQGIY